MISGVILTHNEERNILACIDALRPHVGEIILIDTESTDRTVELARPHVELVLSHPHVPNFDSARNLAIPKARFDWLWFVDADELIPTRTGELVNELIRNRGQEFEALCIPFKTYFCGQWMRHCGWWPGYTTCRVLKRGHFQFSPVLHGGVNLRGRELRFPPDPEIGVPHYSFTNLDHYVAKSNGYTTTEALQLAERNVQYDWRQAIRMMMHEMWHYYEHNNARVDGDRGWIITWMSGQYRWLSHTKLIDQAALRAVPGSSTSVPENLDDVLLAMEAELAACRSRRLEGPLGIVWCMPHKTKLAWVQDSLRLALALAAAERHLTIEAKSIHEISFGSDQDRVLFSALCRARRARQVVTICHDEPAVALPDSSAVLNILRLADHVAVEESLSSFATSLKRFDEIWVSDKERQTACRRLGVPRERLRIVSDAGDAVSHQSNEQGRRTDATNVWQIPTAIADLEARLQIEESPAVAISQLTVELEGEFFAGHSFSNVNENLSLQLLGEKSIALALRRVVYNPVHDDNATHAYRLRPFLSRRFNDAPAITIRHAFPPNFSPLPLGRWVHIQPWEFGYLPMDWISPLRDHVDEIWAPSHYVKRVYVNSGIPEGKIHVIPWGVDPDEFHPGAPALRLNTEKTFRFLFVGGTIPRKGFDRVLDAYLKEFSATDDVCLVVKDVGTQTFYSDQTSRNRILEAMADPCNPRIVYIDDEFTPSQLASLYTACQCLVAPYRGEGFGLPVLEAMACGVPPIVPLGGPTDDFTSDETAFRLASSETFVPEISGLCGTATEFSVRDDVIRQTMRHACANPHQVRQMGLVASRHVNEFYSWSKVARLVVERLHAIAAFDHKNGHRAACLEAIDRHGQVGSATGIQATLSILINPAPELAVLADYLARLEPFVQRIYLVNNDLDERSLCVANEYGAVVVATLGDLAPSVRDTAIAEFESEWILCLKGDETIFESDIESLKGQLSTFSPEVLVANLEIMSDGADPSSPRFEPRLTRRSALLPSDPVLDARRVEELDGRIASTDCGIRQFIRCGIEVRGASSCGENSITQRLAATHRSADLTKSVLIQLADGPHLELLEATRDHHRNYARRHGMDYWQIAGNPAAPRRTGWAKILLILEAMAKGFDRIVWLDADAIIVRGEENLCDAVQFGIGMVQHPNPQHWNTGVICVTRSADTERFFRIVSEMPENESSWMEQLAVNQLAQLPEFSRLLVAMDPRYNSTPGAVMAKQPVIMAAHGLPMPIRRDLIMSWLAGISDKESSADGLIFPGRRDVAGVQSEGPRCPRTFYERIQAIRSLDYSNPITTDAEHCIELFHACHHLAPKSILELGAGCGISGVAIGLACPSIVAVMVDNGREVPQQIPIALWHRFGLQKRFLQQSCIDAMRSFLPASIDFIFHDATHGPPAAVEYSMAWRLLAARGVLAIHDVDKFNYGDWLERLSEVASSTVTADSIGRQLALIRKL